MKTLTLVTKGKNTHDALLKQLHDLLGDLDVTEIQRLEENHRRELVSQANYARYTFTHILGDSQSLTTTKILARKIAHSDSPILIQGESGTGKELFAQGIHNASPRNKGPFIAVNFAALSESLLESELFGYEEGAFTGAKKGGRVGLFTDTTAFTTAYDNAVKGCNDCHVANVENNVSFGMIKITHPTSNPVGNQDFADAK
ncbi:MAG: sigma 54-interacting transcriptional regulator [Desulfitobacteriaceae bacterium]